MAEKLRFDAVSLFDTYRASEVEHVATLVSAPTAPVTPVKQSAFYAWLDTYWDSQ